MEIGDKSGGNPKVSIITVVYNSEKLVEKTIQSIVNQDYENKEFVVIDGASKDRTVEIIKKYENKISFWKSEPDKGIYDAMNKGLQHSTGDYVIFINSGDLLEDGILSKIFCGGGNQTDVFYGETYFINDSGKIIGTRSEVSTRKLPEKLTWKSMKYGMAVAHQSIFVKRALAPEYKLQYCCSSDINWVIEVLKKSKKIENTNSIISRYLVGGFSIANKKKCLKERYKIYLRHYGLFTTIYAHGIILGKNLIHKLSGKSNY